MSRHIAPANEEFLVAWITSNSSQTNAAKKHFDRIYGEPTRKAARDTNRYTLGAMGDHQVVLTELPEGDNEPHLSAAAEAVGGMMRTFDRIRVALFIGTGSGVPDSEHDVRLGDVVVSTSGATQLDYDTSVNAIAFRSAGEVVRAPECVKTAAKELVGRYQTSANALALAILRATEGVAPHQRPGDEFDILYKPSSTHVEIVDEPCSVSCGTDKSKLKARPQSRRKDEDKVVVHLGSIASSHIPIRDPDVRDKLASGGHVLCFDTEAAGLMNTFPYLLIRGIADYADTHSSRMWRGYAGAAACAYARHLMHVLDKEDVKEVDTIEAIAERATKHCPCPAIPSPRSSPPTRTGMGADSAKSNPVPQNTRYQELVGHFLKSEIDTAIRRDRKDLEADLAKLVGVTSEISGYGERMRPLAVELERFQTKWRITQPSLREGRKGAAGHRLENWQKMRHSTGLSSQARFFGLQNELVAFSNGTVLDKDVGYASLQRCLWSVWRVMEYMGLAEDVKFKS
ncbi:pfs domain-containing protein [Colletotrichum kahawae]|uniref:Pfs domain-containing protein n=1 Tax=Colletotrichum kahawae TaxID=34407 RepID=A0AAD9Y742_COLKA|nr:pfs domain-containing protein [Colletotrichum kahawae]